MTTTIPDELRDREDDLAPLTDRTDRIALRNESEHPVVFVRHNPAMALGPTDERTLSPLDVDVGELCHQGYDVDATDIDDVKTVLQTVIDRVETNSGEWFYYTIAGERIQIGGTSLYDYLDALDNFRTIYADLEAPLAEPSNYRDAGFPHETMRTTAVALIPINGLWLWFVTIFSDTPDARRHLSTTLWVTIAQQTNPLTATWLQDRLDHPAIGSPSTVERQLPPAQAHLSLGTDPLAAVKPLELRGPHGRPQTLTPHITVRNPYYRPEISARHEQYDALNRERVPMVGIESLAELDRLPLHVSSGSSDINNDHFVRGECRFTRFGTRDTSRVTLLSGSVWPVPKEKETNVATTIQRTTRNHLKTLLPR